MARARWNHGNFLVRASWLILLGVQLAFLQGCSKPGEHKWLFYDLQNKNDVLYQGYQVTPKEGTDKETTHEKVREFIKKSEMPTKIIALDKPTIDEDDQLHFVFYGPRSRLISENVLCKFTEAPYAQSHDAKMAPPFKMAPPTLSKAQADTALQQAQAVVVRLEALVEMRHQKRQIFEREANRAENRLKQNPSPPNINILTEARDTLRKAENEETEAELQLVLARDMLAQAEKQLSAAFVCDLDVREKGGTRIEHSLAEIQSDKAEKILFKDTVLVHELYRFRVLAGPVFSTVQKRNKEYSLVQNSLGENEVTSSAASDSPANFVLMLKTYLFAKRDLLNPPSLFSSRWCEMINPVIGINLFDKPLENFYAGLSLELIGGFDIVGGVHWAKTEQLTGGFFQGQTTTQSEVATKEQFSNGWFVGVVADTGIIATWLQSAGSGIFKAIKTNP